MGGRAQRDPNSARRGLDYGPSEAGSESGRKPLPGRRSRLLKGIDAGSGLTNKSRDLVFSPHPWVLGGTIQDRLNPEPKNFLSGDMTTDIVVRRLR
jgi:hypothetical protein